MATQLAATWLVGTASTLLQLTLNSTGWAMLLTCASYVLVSDNATLRQRIVGFAVTVFAWKLWWRICWWLIWFTP